jgi:hypothetical protein
MRGLKILILFAVLFITASSSAQYVQPMGYRDYSFWDQFNVGNNGAKLTDPSAFLELGKAAGSLRGLLLPRGNKDSVISPKKGLMYYDLTLNTIVWYDGTSWLPVSSPSLAYGLIPYGGAIGVDTATLKTIFTGAIATGSGISNSGLTVNLGDALTQDAVFSGRSHSLYFGQSATRVNTFNVYTRNGIMIRDTASGGVEPYLSLITGAARVHGLNVALTGTDSLTLDFAKINIPTLTSATLDTSLYDLTVRNKVTKRLERLDSWAGIGGSGSTLLTTLTISADGSYAIPAGIQVETILFSSATGQFIDVGTTLAGDEIWENFHIDAGVNRNLDALIDGGQTIYFTGITASTTIYIFKQS